MEIAIVNKIFNENYRFPLGLGLKVIEIKPQPKLKLRENCPVTDKFRESFNSWLVENFGYMKLIEDTDAYILNGDTLLASKALIDKLKLSV